MRNRLHISKPNGNLTLRLSIAVLCLACPAAWAQAPRGGTIRQGTIYLSPDASSAKIGEVDRGREVTILETSREWAHVEAQLTEERVVTGWVLDKSVIRTSTPNGDKVLFGEAVDSEDEASRRRGRRGAAQDAMHLYYRVYDLFPSSPLAGEALYRAADVKWQLDKVDIMTKPSAREQDPYLRGEIDPTLMKLVMKKFPGTKWADLAAFHLIDNKLCGDWQGASKCPTKEAEIYENYVKDHSQSPNVAEALYDAAWRWSALIEIYKTEDQQKKSQESKNRALEISQRVVTQYPQGDWGARAQRLLYMVQQDIPTWGNEQP